ncbi:MAG: hypothetical protein GF341_00770, partial [candidate division Zixibacteria bacterium]|nr:hypothetical protein [candidate division Zixibacteria bacterium]
MPRLRHYDNLGLARFVTFSCYHRYKLLRHPRVIRQFLSEMERMRNNGIDILGYVIMPEHVHLVLLPPDGTRLGVEIGRLKSRSAREMSPILDQLYGQRTEKLRVRRDGEERRVFWQRRCYDHNCRTTETAKEKIVYCHKNPVKRGLAGSPGDYPWSS